MTAVSDLNAAAEAAKAMGYDLEGMYPVVMSALDAFDVPAAGGTPQEVLDRIMERFTLFRPYMVGSEPDLLIRVMFPNWEITTETLNECFELRRDGMPDELIAALYGLDLFAPLPTFPDHHMSCDLSGNFLSEEYDTLTTPSRLRRVIDMLTPARWR